MARKTDRSDRGRNESYRESYNYRKDESGKEDLEKNKNKEKNSEKERKHDWRFYSYEDCVYIQCLSCNLKFITHYPSDQEIDGTKIRNTSRCMNHIKDSLESIPCRRDRNLKITKKGLERHGIMVDSLCREMPIHGKQFIKRLKKDLKWNK